MTGLHTARYIFIILLLVFAICVVVFATRKVDR
jgi:cbb3-type cytochrome oxidase subunit 3